MLRAGPGGSTAVALGLSLVLAVPATAPGQGPPRSIRVIDLAQAGARSITVPEGQDLEIGLENASPSALYRVSQKTGPFPARSRELPAPFDNGFRRYTPSAACATLKQDGLTLIATEDEAEIAGRVQALQARLASSSCPDVEKRMVGFTIDMTRPSLREILRLTPGQELTVTVERLSAQSRVPLRTWVATFRGGVPDVGWTFPDEQTWIVREIAQDVLEMVRFAKSRARTSTALAVKADGVAAGSTRYRIEAGFPVPLVVSASPHVWAPEAYAELARALMKADSVTAAPETGTAGPPTLERLTDLRAPMIEAENLAVSKRLMAQVLSARAHEEAAVVAGALALRESARSFSDTRRTLSRMTAHLALAQAVRGQHAAGPDGRLAVILLTTLVGRQVEALELLARMESRPDVTRAERAWATALSMRNDGDWRRLREPAKATLIERLEYFRALARADNASRALEGLPIRPPDDVPDWGRQAMATSFSVEEGNRFVRDAIARELQELDRVWTVSHATPLPVDRIVAILQTAPGRAVHVANDGKTTIQVLDWGAWASAGVRHVYADLETADSFLRYQLRLKEAADELRTRAEAAFGTLPLQPLAALRSGGSATPPGFCDAMGRIIRQAPDSLTAINWDFAYRQCARVTAGFPSYTSWFAPVVPAGTAFDVDRRLRTGDIALKVDLAAIEGLRRLAPYNESVVLAYLGKKYGAKLDPAVVAQEFGRMAEYQVSALRRIQEASKDDPAARLATLEKMCAASADRCVDLGVYLAWAQSPDAAARAYQKAVDGARDRVYVANSVEWLVNYYHDHGDTAKALALATMAAEAYSEKGLETMARYQERLKNYDEAERYYKAAEERYGQGRLADFYLRYQKQVGGDRFAREAKAASERVFPSGLKKVALSDLQAPANGVLVTNPANGQGWGLRVGDVVVALDGYRVENTSQYAFAKALSQEPKMRLFVQRGNGFVELMGDRSHIVYFRRSP
jgi:hypothetical protein